MMKKLWLGIFVGVLFLVSGCANLADYDLSGGVSMYESTGSNGYYQMLSSNDFQNMELSKTGFLFNIFSMESLLRMLDLQNQERDIPVTICNTDYIVKWDNKTGVQIFDKNGEDYGLIQVEESVDGELFDFFDFNDLSWVDKTNIFEKLTVYKFPEPGGSEFKLVAYWKFKVHCTRIIEEFNGRKRVKDFTIRPSFYSSLKIAYWNHLSGQKTVQGKKDKEIRIRVSVYDENLDGKFDNQDVAVIHNFTNVFRLGREIIFDRKGKVRYFFDLYEEERPSYILNVEKITD